MRFILIEGVNLYQNLFETDQLSVIRGTSFIYKDAISHVSNFFKDTLIPIRTGASSGVYLCPADTDSEKMCESIRSRLHADADYSLVPFIVVTAQADSLSDAMTLLLTRLRFEQLKTPSILPDQNLENSDSGVCELSGVRIQARGGERQVQSVVNAPTRKLSLSIERRYQYGREKKQHFYQDLVTDSTAKSLESYEFAQSLEEISADPSIELGQSDPLFPKLAGKLAVFYADGNRISRVQQQYIEQTVLVDKIKEIDAQKKFDQEIQQCRESFLNDTIQWMLDEERRTGFSPLSTTSSSPKKVLRLETLLWGGDEMIFVLPAWRGFEFLQRFFAWDWQLSALEAPVTHAAGIVFCHDKSPIRVIQDLTRQLADNIKNTSGGRDKDGWDYLVLESIDYPTNPNLEHFFDQRYGEANRKCRNASLPPISHWPQKQSKLIAALQNGLISSKQLHRITRTIQHQCSLIGCISWQAYFDPAPVESKHALTRAEMRWCEIHPDRNWLQHELPVLAEQYFGLDIEVPHQRCWFWLHLTELSNYMVPSSETPQAVTAVTTDQLVRKL